MATFRFEMPAPRSDVPAPATKAVRRVELDGGTWVDVRGGGSQLEGRFLSWAFELVKGPFVDDEAGTAEAKRHAAEVEMNACLASFIGSRVVGHNLTDADGNRYPLGEALYWALSNQDAMALIRKIQSPPRVIVDPKAESPSSGG